MLMPDLPHDIWAIIATLLDRIHLLTLVSVNRAFYNVVLDQRYGEIWWISLDKSMLRTLVYLQLRFYFVFI
jgi:hypothetical protein